MEYLVGAALALIVAVFAAVSGFDRDRAFYPAMLVVIASYYDLFAVMAGSGQALGLEALAGMLFVATAVIGFRTSLWLVVVALVAHGLFDLVHGQLIANPGVPAWWPMFCLTFDIVAGAGLAVRLLRTGAAVRASHAAVPLVLILAAMPAASACAQPPTDIRTVQADGHMVDYRVLGSGAPTLVLISGLGNGMETFDKVAPEFAKQVTVIIYDRAGYGQSGLAPTPRDAGGAERELLAVLADSGVPGPYILLGHSLGGLYAEYFAARHPDMIAGLILEESRPADFTRRCEALGLSDCVMTVEMARGQPAHIRAEVAALPTLMDEVEAAGPVAGKPVLVLSRHVSANPGPMDAAWRDGQADLAARYPGAEHFTAPKGGHYIHRQARAWFEDKVEAFLRDK